MKTPAEIDFEAMRQFVEMREDSQSHTPRASLTPVTLATWGLDLGEFERILDEVHKEKFGS